MQFRTACTFTKVLLKFESNEASSHDWESTAYLVHEIGGALRILGRPSREPPISAGSIDMDVSKLGLDEAILIEPGRAQTSPVSHVTPQILVVPKVGNARTLAGRRQHPLTTVPSDARQFKRGPKHGITSEAAEVDSAPMDCGFA